MKLNLGCGKDKLKGYINMDMRDYGHNIVRDVRRGIPFNDNTFDEVFTSHFMEHIGHEDIYFVVEEVYRVLKDGGKFIIRVPHSGTPQAFFPDHVSFWNKEMVYALIHDPYQNYGQYKYSIEMCTYAGMELQVILKAIKEGE